MIVEKHNHMVDTLVLPDRSVPSFTLIKKISDMGSPYYPLNFLNRPMLIFNIARILEGNAPLDAIEKHRDEVKIGAFKVDNVCVLLVDDHPANLIVAEGMLKQYGISVQTASGGLEAIEKARQIEYDIIFMDHMMPEIDGVEATKRIRDLGGRHSNTIIIALSANAVSGAREIFISSGMNDFLSKPLIVNDLHKMLLKYIPHDRILVQ
jgi:CheY-like chemotaxis protein